jgi:arylsulfate sulfotransferase
MRRKNPLLQAAFAALILNTCAFAASARENNKKTIDPSQATVTATANPQVAQYTLSVPLPATWSVAFGTSTAYGQSTSIQSTRPNQPSSLYVAGMLPNTTYHMQATATFPDGTTTTDVDHIFTTGALPSGIPASLPITLGVTGPPQPGVELLDPLTGSLARTVLATDLQGNVIWTYVLGDAPEGTWLFPAKLMPNGNIVMFLAPPSYPVNQPGWDIMREVDLAGNTIRELSMANLNAALQKTGLSADLANFSHDFTILPNGHYLIVANQARVFNDLPGYSGQTTVVGDAIVDLDADWKPVWVWNEFDHLDVNRHPMGFPDWTHTNSVAYSASDGNFIVSMRHQNWVIKVDYRNGEGTGNVLWRLGKDGDFALKGGVDPTDWFYGQHDAMFESTQTSGSFVLSIMDNGNDRVFPPDVTCGVGNGPDCFYSTIQLLQVDEAAKTASFQFHQVLPSYLYSAWGGNVEVLANGDVEYNLSGINGGSEIFEVTNEPTPRSVWSSAIPGNNAYRGFRLPSLYPGVQW